MKRIIVALGLTLLVLVGFVGSVHGQVTISTSHIPIDQLNVGDIDFQTGGNRNWFFTISISGPPQTVSLLFQASAQLPDANFENALQFETDTFHIPLTFTNLDIGSTSNIKIKPGTRVEFNEEAKTRIQNEALATGKLPAGTYTFNLTLHDAQGNEIPTQGDRQIVLTLRNISRLDLISPRDEESVSNPFPLFQWIFDGTRVELSVYERLPQHHSREEAAQGTPSLVQVLEGVRSFQYPTTAPRPLEPGKTYVWKVRGFVSGSGGVNTVINSEIWEFSVASTGGLSGNRLTGGGGGSQNLINQLQNLPGLGSSILAQLNSGNLQFTGVLLLNGVPVSSAEILAILNDLSQNPDKIIDIQFIER